MPNHSITQHLVYSTCAREVYVVFAQTTNCHNTRLNKFWVGVKGKRSLHSLSKLVQTCLSNSMFLQITAAPLSNYIACNQSRFQTRQPSNQGEAKHQDSMAWRTISSVFQSSNTKVPSFAPTTYVLPCSLALWKLTDWNPKHRKNDFLQVGLLLVYDIVKIYTC